MRTTRYLTVTTVAALLIYGGAGLSLLLETTPPVVHASTSTPNPEVAPQYDTTHVYVSPEDFDRFVASLVATFGGTTTKQGVFTVTPTPSSTMSQLVMTPVGTISVFGFKTPVPYSFGAERTGYLVTDLDGATRTAVKDGADVLVSPFNDPIGRDVVIQWPGGVNMQLYWHTTAPSTSRCRRFRKTGSTRLPTRWRRSFVASWPFLTAKWSPMTRIRPASRSDGRRTAIAESGSNRPSAS